MTEADKPKFAELLATLFGAHNRTVWDGAAAGYWKGLGKMSLMQFERCVEKAIDKLAHAERGVAKIPTVSELWDIGRGIRSYEAPKVSSEPQWHGDAWDMAANTLLLAHIARQRDMRLADRYAPDSPYSVKLHHVVVGPLTKEHTAVLVKWKDAWARDMREDREVGGTSDGKPAWFECMALAEAELDRMIAATVAA